MEPHVRKLDIQKYDFRFPQSLQEYVPYDLLRRV
jgi:hypothetical protein